MQTALARLIKFMQAKDWKRALALAARWHDLGEQKRAIVGAHEALAHPNFYRQLGHDPEAMVQAGIAALLARYGHAVSS